MNALTKQRKKLTTPAEKKMCATLQAVVWFMNGIVRFQRERPVHLADMMSRSLDFYFSQGKLGIEVDGGYHREEIQAAKDKWTDELMLKHDNILVLRFTNEEVLNDTYRVVAVIVTNLRNRHNWPKRLKDKFDKLLSHTATKESWNKALCIFYQNR